MPAIPVCPGCCRCGVYNESFDGATRKLNGIEDIGRFTPDRSSDTDPTYFWWLNHSRGTLETITSLGDGTYLASLDVSSPTGTIPSGPYRYFVPQAPPRHFRFSFNFDAGIRTGRFRAVYQAISSDPLQSKRYAFEIEVSSLFGSDDDSATECGFLRIFDVTDLLAEAQIGATVPVPGLCARPSDPSGGGHFVMHKGQMCYDPETQLLSCSVTLASGGGPNCMHAINLPTAEDPLDEPVLWLEPMEFPTGGSTYGGSYIFDNVRITQTKNIPDDYTGEYGAFGEDEPSDCPCCGPRDCQSTTFDPNDPPCNVLNVEDTIYIYQRSWSGIDEDCMIDPTTFISVRFRTSADDYGSGPFTLRLMTNVYGAATYYLPVAVTFDNDSGTISVNGGDEVAVPGLAADGEWHLLTVCYDGSTLVGICDGTSAAAAVIDINGGMFTAIDVDLDVIEVEPVTVSHNIFSVDCPDCLSGCASAACSDSVPPGLKIRAHLPSSPLVNVGPCGDGQTLSDLTIFLTNVECCDNFLAPFCIPTCTSGQFENHEAVHWWGISCVGHNCAGEEDDTTPLEVHAWLLHYEDDSAGLLVLLQLPCFEGEPQDAIVFSKTLSATFPMACWSELVQRLPFGCYDPDLAPDLWCDVEPIG